MPDNTDANHSLLCPVRHALNIIGGKWKLPILCLLANYPFLRYNAIKRKMGVITNMMLTQSLKELETDGIIYRKQYNEIPPRVEYYLSEHGKNLLPALKLLAQWSISLTPETNICDSCKSDALAEINKADSKAVL